MRKMVFLLTLSALAFATDALATPQDFNGKLVDIEYWGGSGSNEAVCVVDFGDDSHAFGYRWSDGATVTRPSSFFADTFGYSANAGTSEAMLLVLDQQADLTVSYHYDNVLGLGVDGFSYNGESIASDGWVTTYLAFYISGSPAYDEEIWEEDPPGSGNWEQTGTIHHDAMAPDGETWVFSQWGATTRVLSDGYYDGWSEGNAQTWSSSPPDVPVPEPAAMVLLVVALPALLRRRRRSTC